MIRWLKRKRPKKPNIDFSFLDELSATDLLVVLSLIDLLNDD